MPTNQNYFLTTRQQKLLYDLTCLKLWYAFDVTCSEGHSFSDILYSQTTFYSTLPWHLADPQPDVPAQNKALWIKWVNLIEPLYTQYAPLKSIQLFVKEAATIVFPIVVEAEWRHCLATTEPWFGCFRYGFNPDQRVIRLHFKNAYMPDSPFADMPRLFGTLRDLVADIEAKGLTPEGVVCGSWINNLPRFQALFPKSYVESLTPTSPEEKTGDGWWGQFTSRKGTLHKPRAELLKKERRFEFVRLRGDCPFREFKEHVLKSLTPS